MGINSTVGQKIWAPEQLNKSKTQPESYSNMRQTVQVAQDRNSQPNQNEFDEIEEMGEQSIPSVPQGQQVEIKKSKIKIVKRMMTVQAQPETNTKVNTNDIAEIASIVEMAGSQQNRTNYSENNGSNINAEGERSEL